MLFWLLQLLLLLSTFINEVDGVSGIHEKINLRSLQHMDSSEKLPRVPTPRINCVHCARPANVCICRSLPSQPYETSLKVIVLQHPNEGTELSVHDFTVVSLLTHLLDLYLLIAAKRGPTSSIPLVELCHKNTFVIRGITFDSKGTYSRSIGKANSSSFKKTCQADVPWWEKTHTSRILQEAFNNVQNSPPLLFFPGEESIDIRHICSENADDDKGRNFSRNLIIIDGTWVYAFLPFSNPYPNPNFFRLFSPNHLTLTLTRLRPGRFSGAHQLLSGTPCSFDSLRQDRV